jgi:hypothetical protein
MPKITAPLLSFGASGQIAKTQVYSKWKGRPYARRYTIPANPNSDAQKKVRTAWTYLQEIWKFAGTELVDPFTAYAKGKVLTNRNAFLKFDQKAMVRDGDNLAIYGSPGAYGGVVADSIAAADAGGQHATVTLGVPTVPDGWTITDSIALLIEKATYAGSPDFEWQNVDGDPASFQSYGAASGDALGVIDVPAVAGTFVVLGWFKMTNANGQTAYGQSLATTVALA